VTEPTTRSAARKGAVFFFHGVTVPRVFSFDHLSLTTRFHHMSEPVTNSTAGARPKIAHRIFTVTPPNRPMCSGARIATNRHERHRCQTAEHRQRMEQEVRLQILAVAEPSVLLGYGIPPNTTVTPVRTVAGSAGNPAEASYF
jgi:hypothetical protein